MEKVAKAYKAEFVVNISEPGEDDPLTKNASRLFSSMNVPWYNTGASKDCEVGCFLHHINMTDSKILTMAGVDTEKLQNEEQIEVKHVYEPLHHIFLKYGVNAYLSRQGCTNHGFQDAVAYICIMDPVNSQPYSASLNGSLAFQKEMDTGRVNFQEIATYFVTLTGEVVNRVVIQQRGKELM